MSKPFVPIADVSTDDVLPEQRVAFWESYNASALIGLRCSAFAAHGLKARARSFDLETVRITDLRGNEHVVERTAPMVRTNPQDSIFACLLREGEGFFYQSGQCVSVRPGDVVAYSTDIPYLYGFTRDSRQLIVQTDAAQLLGAGSADRPRCPVKLDAQLRSGRLLARVLWSTAADFVDHPYAEDATRVAARSRDLLRELVSTSGAGTREELSDGALWKLLRAETIIADHLSDPNLTADMIARRMNISVRHLNRLFAAQQRSVTHWILGQRLARAEQDLVSPRARSTTIGDIAFRWAFASQAHFSRCFKSRYGLTPTEYRRRAWVGGSTTKLDLAPTP
jgi:AraC-like DNA-binding protein